MGFSLNGRVAINAPDHPWHQRHARIHDLEETIAIVSVWNQRGREAFPIANLSPLCDEPIAGHNGAYSFPCVRPEGHDGGCNRAYPSGARCKECGCDSHVDAACTNEHCGSAPCRAGLSWDAWYTQQQQEVTTLGLSWARPSRVILQFWRSQGIDVDVQRS